MIRVRTGASLAAVTLAGLMLAACGGGNSNSAAPQQSASALATTDAPQEVPSELPSASDLPSSSPSSMSPSPTDTRNIVVPRNVVTLDGVAPKKFPTRAFARDNGNEYPKQVFTILRDTNMADGYSSSSQLKWGQVSIDEWIDCGDKVYGGDPAHQDPASVWCQKYGMLMTAPGVIIADPGNDPWGVLRQMVFAYSQAELALKNANGATPDPSVALCMSGRLIRSLHEHGYFNRSDTDAWLRSYLGTNNAATVGEVYQGFATASCN